MFDSAIEILEFWHGDLLHPHDRTERAEALGIEWSHLFWLESALVDLINLNILSYNNAAFNIGLEQIPYKFYKNLQEVYNEVSN